MLDLTADRPAIAFQCSRKELVVFSCVRLGFMVVAVLAAGCGGGGGGGSTSGSPDGTAASKVFVSYRYVGGTIIHGVGSVSNDNPSPGTLAVDRDITGASTGLTTTSKPFFDSVNNRLYVLDASRVLVFDNANVRTGNVAPTRTIVVGGAPNDLQVDVAGNRLYVSDSTKVMVFDNASSLNGSVVSSRTITPALSGETLTIYSIAVDATRNVLYIAGPGSTSNGLIAVFNGAATANGATAPTGMVVRGGSGQVADMAVDATNNRLYVTADFRIDVYDSANSITTGSTNRSIQPIDPANPTWNFLMVGVAINPATGRLYAAATTSAFVLSGIQGSTSGNVNGVRVLAPLGVDFHGITVAQ